MRLRAAPKHCTPKDEAFAVKPDLVSNDSAAWCLVGRPVFIDSRLKDRHLNVRNGRKWRESTRI
jgi:hypothetical protein